MQTDFSYSTVFSTCVQFPISVILVWKLIHYLHRVLDKSSTTRSTSRITRIRSHLITKSNSWTHSPQRYEKYQMSVQAYGSSFIHEPVLGLSSSSHSSYSKTYVEDQWTNRSKRSWITNEPCAPFDCYFTPSNNAIIPSKIKSMRH